MLHASLKSVARHRVRRVAAAAGLLPGRWGTSSRRCRRPARLPQDGPGGASFDAHCSRPAPDASTPPGAGSTPASRATSACSRSCCCEQDTAMTGTACNVCWDNRPAPFLLARKLYPPRTSRLPKIVRRIFQSTGIQCERTTSGNCRPDASGVAPRRRSIHTKAVINRRCGCSRARRRQPRRPGQREDSEAKNRTMAGPGHDVIWATDRIRQENGLAQPAPWQYYRRGKRH